MNPAGPRNFDAEFLRSRARFVVHAPRRHPLLAAGCFSLVFALCAICLWVLPKTYRVEASIVGEPLPAVTVTLSNPARYVRGEQGEATHDAIETVLRPENLERIVRETGLVESWKRSRPAVLLFKDAVLIRMSARSPSHDDLVLAVADLLERRATVSAYWDRVVAVVEWPEAAAAARVADALLRGFQEVRQATELSAVQEAITILEQHDADVRREIDSLESRRTLKNIPIGLKSQSEERGEALRSRLERERHTISDLQALRSHKASELRAELTDLLESHSTNDPGVLDVQARILALAKPSPALALLMEDEVELGKEQLVAASNLEAQDPPSATPEKDQEERRTLNEKDRSLRTRIDDARIDEETIRATFAARYSVVVPAQAPKSPDRPKVAGMLTSGIIGGLLLALFASVAADLRARRVVEQWQVREELGLRLLAEVREP